MKIDGRHPASFRDPAGYLFREHGGLYRAITPAGAADFQRFLASGLAAELTGDGRVIPFLETGPRGRERIIQVEALPFVSYPFEWSFGQLRDAAVLTLELELAALQHGLTLKDGSAYNVAWRGGRPVFLDHGSFAVHEEGAPWTGYRQFVMHFLGPLLAMKYRDHREILQLRSFTDGLPLDYVAKLLPRRTLLMLYPLIHIHLHAFLEKRHAGGRTKKSAALPRRKLVDMLSCLRDFIAGLTPPKDLAGVWTDYYGDTNYPAAAFAAKQELCAAVCRELRPALAVDFGCNTGEFTRLAAKEGGGTVIAADADAGSIERLYASIRGDGAIPVLPVLQDLNNPTSRFGVMSREFDGFLTRCRSDFALGLALIHHLRIGGNWPLKTIARLFGENAPNALVEFVPKQDSQVQRLLASRPDICDDWTLEEVCRAFSPYYQSIEVLPLPESERVLLKLWRIHR